MGMAAPGTITGMRGGVYRGSRIGDQARCGWNHREFGYRGSRDLDDADGARMEENVRSGIKG